MRIRHALATAVLGTTLALGAMAVPAQAAPAAPSTSAVTGVIATANAPTPSVYYNTYSTLAACQNAGATGDFHGVWYRWSCTRTLRGYELWVTYF